MLTSFLNYKNNHNSVNFKTPDKKLQYPELEIDNLFNHISFYQAYISVHTKVHTSSLPGTTLKVFGGGGWWLKVTLVFCFGPNWTFVIVLGFRPSLKIVKTKRAVSGSLNYNYVGFSKKCLTLIFHLQENNFKYKIFHINTSPKYNKTIEI